MKLIRVVKNTIETNKVASKIFDLFCNTIIYKKIINIKINSYLKKLKINKNYNVIIETTNICNAKCVMCPHPKMKRPRVVMSDQIFKLIIQRIKEEKINPIAFIVNGFGEPFTDKKITTRIKNIKSNFPNSIVKIYTNASLLNDKNINELILSGLDEINISFNGYDKSTYESTMKISYDNSLKNLKKIIKKNKNKIKIRISSTLVYSNELKIKKFIKKWENKVESVSANKAHNYGDSIEKVSDSYQIDYNKKNIFPCKYIFNTIVINTLGDINLCCLDYEAKYNFGSIKDTKILDIFYSKKFETIRKVHLRKMGTNMEICKHCYTPYKNGTEWLIDNLY